MANYVRSRFVLIGNEAVKKYSEDLRVKLEKNLQETGNNEDLSAVGRIIYGLSGDSAYLSYDEVGAKWVMVDGDVIDSGLAFISAWDPPTLLQDHLLNEIYNLDPQAIILMEYEDEMPNFVGARYVVMNDNAISEEDFREDLTSYHLVSEDDFDEAVAENEQTEEYERVITWEDIQLILDEQKEMAFENIQANNEWIDDEIINVRW